MRRILLLLPIVCLVPHAFAAEPDIFVSGLDRSSLRIEGLPFLPRLDSLAIGGLDVEVFKSDDLVVKVFYLKGAIRPSGIVWLGVKPPPLGAMVTEALFAQSRESPVQSLHVFSVRNDRLEAAILAFPGRYEGRVVSRDSSLTESQSNEIRP